VTALKGLSSSKKNPFSDINCSCRQGVLIFNETLKRYFCHFPRETNCKSVLPMEMLIIAKATGSQSFGILVSVGESEDSL
jgi:hypothetical protein